MSESDIKRLVQKNINNQNVGELSPGTVGRRYEPIGGLKKHNDRIHKESDYTDKYKKMPYTFSKPKKLQRTVIKECCNCGSLVSVTKNSVGVICPTCKKYSSVREINLVEK